MNKFVIALVLTISSHCLYSQEVQLPSSFHIKMNEDLYLLERNNECRDFRENDLKKHKIYPLKAVYFDEDRKLTSADVNIHFYHSKKPNSHYGYSYCLEEGEYYLSDVLFFLSRDIELSKVSSGILLENSYSSGKNDIDKLVYEINGKKYSFHRSYYKQNNYGTLHFELNQNIKIPMNTCVMPSDYYETFPGCNSKKLMEIIEWAGDLDNDGYPELVIKESKVNSSKRIFVSAKGRVELKN